MSIMSSEVSTERKFSDKIKNISSITLNKTTYKQIETNVFFFQIIMKQDIYGSIISTIIKIKYLK